MTKGDSGQQKSHLKSPTFERLEKLRIITGKTWEQIAEQLNVDKSMLFHVKAGKRNLSSKSLFRLEEAERAAGIQPQVAQPSQATRPQSRSYARAVVESISSRLKEAGPDITAEDYDRGFVDVSVSYLRGKRPKGLPASIRLIRPDAHTSAKLLAEVVVSENPEILLLACLPSQYAQVEFLNKLSPFSIHALREAALSLVLGLNWRKNFPRFASAELL